MDRDEIEDLLNALIKMISEAVEIYDGIQNGDYVLKDREGGDVAV